MTQELLHEIGDQETRRIQGILEALLLCSAEPLTLATLSEITGCQSGAVLEALDRLQQDYYEQGRGFAICEIAGGWMFATFPQHAPYIEKLVKPRISSLSQASLEVLSIIAYRQPVTRGEMEEIRGVNCDSSVNTLLDRGLIREAGRKDVPGKPLMFATTTDFLKYFGLTSIRDLPEIESGELADLASDSTLGAAETEDADAEPNEQLDSGVEGNPAL
ncbi:MAG: SMC-Scp complex subunit ScpB [Syntrophorhabdaceae bacterium]|nr:SMC-Scp complex subunit ScpB [Syntrophorhabdaceae bacterium]